MKKLSLTLIAVLAALAIAGTAGAQKTHKTHATKYRISAKQAGVIAIKKYHGKIIGKIALENEEGKMQYAVNVKTGKTLREVMVGANSGKVENVEVTTKAEEAKEAAAEKKGSKKVRKATGKKAQK